MTGFGVLLIILGGGSLLLPLFDLQFTLMEFVDPYQPWAGIIVTVIGAALVGYGLQRSRAAATAAPPTSSAAAPAATAPLPPAPEAPVAPAAQGVPPPVDTTVSDAPDAPTDPNRDRA
jgi:hypothetical protein